MKPPNPDTVAAAAVEMAADARASASAAGLRYVSDERPGIRRLRSGRSVRYLGPDGRPVRDPETLERIRSLAIPPAWTDVWISPAANGHIQATGRDARGRKQYRYHERWREIRDETKFHRMMLFGQALPRIRRRVARDLALHGIPREKVMAAIVRLMDTVFLRIGNAEYAKQNDSFGLTTMHNRHANVKGAHVRFQFRGKSGKPVEVELEDRRVARVIRRCQDLPGYELFCYVDDAGTVRDVASEDVNDYLREISGQEFTAKDFRTWAGTLLAARILRGLRNPRDISENARKKGLVAAIREVAQNLGNTPAVCRKHYVHPAVIEAFAAGSLADAFTIPGRAHPRTSAGLASEERCLIAFLRSASRESHLAELVVRRSRSGRRENGKKDIADLALTGALKRSLARTRPRRRTDG